MINLNKVEGYVKHGLKEALRSDLRKLKILKEADVECCAYHHLRKFMRGDKRWRIFARKYSSRTGYYTDLMIFLKNKERIAIEIKWRRNTISGKDRRALRSVRSEPFTLDGPTSSKRSCVNASTASGVMLCR